MVSKIVIVTVVAFVVMGFMHQATAIASGAVNPAILAWKANAPWMPRWVACDPAQALGATCEDCSTKRVCKPVGGLLKLCTEPGLPHCNAGECSATPSAQCAAAAEAAPV